MKVRCPFSRVRCSAADMSSRPIDFGKRAAVLTFLNRRGRDEDCGRRMQEPSEHDAVDSHGGVERTAFGKAGVNTGKHRTFWAQNDTSPAGQLFLFNQTFAGITSDRANRPSDTFRLGPVLNASRGSAFPIVDSAAGRLLRRVGLFDATMLVMGGIVGSGIFINAYVVARQVHTPVLILAAWIVGGLLAMLGAFIYAELADRMPDVGGQYAYLREAYHPAVGFLYGWVLLLVIQTGGMAAVTVTFARYFAELTDWNLPEGPTVVATLTLLTLINCLGVKLGSRVQSALMVLKIAAIAGLVVAGFLLIRAPLSAAHPVTDQPMSFSLATAFGAAMVPVLFAFGGWQTTNFVAGEIKEPRKNLPRALLIGVAGVITLYVTVNMVYVRALGSDRFGEYDGARNRCDAACPR